MRDVDATFLNEAAAVMALQVPAAALTSRLCVRCMQWGLMGVIDSRCVQESHNRLGYFESLARSEKMVVRTLRREMPVSYQSAGIRIYYSLAL